MSKRTKTGQKKHDSNVLKWAKQKEKEGFKVTADLPGWKKPPKVEGEVPDGYAEKGKENKSILIQIDTIPNILKLSGQEKFVKEILREELEQDLDNRISRYRELPAIMVHEYVKILHKTRRLYVEGKFYSCVAMCGVTSERIAKDILKRIILVKKVNKATPSKFFNQLDRIPMDIVRELIIAAGSVDSSLRNAFKQLASLRDKYVHASQIGSQEDAQKAIKYLHEIIEGTVSVFKEYKIQKGKLVRK